jgi:hypothetical protein
MKIANPLFDKGFKYLMENEKFARKVISVILDEEVRDRPSMHVMPAPFLFPLRSPQWKHPIPSSGEPV